MAYPPRTERDWTWHREVHGIAWDRMAGGQFQTGELKPIFLNPLCSISKAISFDLSFLKFMICRCLKDSLKFVDNKIANAIMNNLNQILIVALIL